MICHWQVGERQGSSVSSVFQILTQKTGSFFHPLLRFHPQTLRLFPDFIQPGGDPLGTVNHLRVSICKTTVEIRTAAEQLTNFPIDLFRIVRRTRLRLLFDQFQNQVRYKEVREQGQN